MACAHITVTCVDIVGRTVLYEEDSHVQCAHKNTNTHTDGTHGASNRGKREYDSYNLNDLLPLKFGPMDLMSDGKAFPLLLAQQTHEVSLHSAFRNSRAQFLNQQ